MQFNNQPQAQDNSSVGSAGSASFRDLPHDVLLKIIEELQFRNCQGQAFVASKIIWEAFTYEQERAMLNNRSPVRERRQQEAPGAPQRRIRKL